MRPFSCETARSKSSPFGITVIDKTRNQVIMVCLFLLIMSNLFFTRSDGVVGERVAVQNTSSSSSYHAIQNDSQKSNSFIKFASQQDSNTGGYFGADISDSRPALPSGQTAVPFFIYCFSVQLFYIILLCNWFAVIKKCFTLSDFVKSISKIYHLCIRLLYLVLVASAKCLKFSTFPWVSLTPTDRHVLASTDEYVYHSFVFVLVMYQSHFMEKGNHHKCIYRQHKKWHKLTW